MNQAESKDGRITAVIAQHTRSGRRTRVTGTLFLDSTGDGVVGALVGADFEITDEGHMGVSNLWNVGDTTKNEFQIQCECKDTDALSMAFVQSEEEVPFPRCPWAVDLSDKPFPGRKGFDKSWNGKQPLYRLGGWFWESGFNKDPINDVEWMRDQNLRAMYGAWDALKNVDKAHPNHRLKWAAYIAGKRESRRLLGDVVLTGDDILTGKELRRRMLPLHVVDRPASAAPGFRRRQRRRRIHLAGEFRQVRRPVLGAVSLPLQPQHWQPVHGRARHQRHARSARRGARDAHHWLHGRNRRHGGVDLPQARLLPRETCTSIISTSCTQLMAAGTGRKSAAVAGGRRTEIAGPRRLLPVAFLRNATRSANSSTVSCPSSPPGITETRARLDLLDFVARQSHLLIRPGGENYCLSVSSRIVPLIVRPSMVTTRTGS